MKYTAVFALLLGSCFASPLATSAADPVYIDPNCSNVGPAVQRYVTLVKSDTTLVSDAVSAANAASDAFDRCADRYRSAGDAEHLHYASIGSAQYHYAAGHLLRLDAHFDEARIAFNIAIAELADTIAWGTPSAPSAYKANAIEVRDAAKDDLSKLPPEGTIVLPSATPSAAPSTAASPPRIKFALRSQGTARSHKIAAFSGSADLRPTASRCAGCETRV